MSGRLGPAALAFVGVPFRLHGRDPVHGLDCVGLVAAAMAAQGLNPVAPNGYRLRIGDIGPWLSAAAASQLREVDQGGDIALALVAPLQPHLLIMADGGFVHAHAGLGRVTFAPGPVPWPILRRWRVNP